MSKVRASVLILLVGCVLPGAVRAQAPEGPAFRVNELAVDNHGNQAIGSDAAGNLVLVWRTVQ